MNIEKQFKFVKLFSETSYWVVDKESNRPLAWINYCKKKNELQYLPEEVPISQQLGIDFISELKKKVLSNNIKFNDLSDIELSQRLIHQSAHKKD